MTLAVRARLAVLALAGAALVSLGGCATPQRPDPLEPMNRKIFAFNDAVDAAVLKPVATAYRDVVPSPVRTAFGNFFGNVRDVWSAVNLFLQGRVSDGLNQTMRVATNTVFGLLGLMDFATPVGLVNHEEDFGQTLGVWGMGPGPYLVLPLLGPSTGRDVIGLPPEFYFSAERHLDMAESSRYLLSGVKVVDTRANLLDASKLLDEVALDKYAFMRNAFLQRRRSLIYNGNPPEDEASEEAPPEPEERYDLPEPAAPAAGK